MLLRDLRRLPQQRFCYQYQTEFSLWHKGERLYVRLFARVLINQLIDRFFQTPLLTAAGMAKIGLNSFAQQSIRRQSKKKQ